MYPSADEALSKFETLKGQAGERLSTYRVLRNYYEGRVAPDAPRPTEIEGEGFRLPINYLAGAVNLAQFLTAELPEIQVPPPKESFQGRRLADRMEKALYAFWYHSKLAARFADITWFLSCLGTVVLGIIPAPKTETKFRAVICDPNHFFVVPTPDDPREPLELYRAISLTARDWKAKYPGVAAIEALPDTTDLHEGVEYWDSDHRALYLTTIKPEQATKKVRLEPVAHYTHKWKRVPFVFIPNLPLPDAAFGESDIEKAVGLNDSIKHFHSRLADMLEYMANPPLVIQGWGVSEPTAIPSGPGAVICIPRDATAHFLEPPQVPAFMESFLARTMEAIAFLTGFQEPIYQRIAPAGRTGAAIKAMGGPMQLRTNFRQIRLSEGLKDLNALFLQGLESYFGGTSLALHGNKKGHSFSVQFAPSQINGYHECELIWAPSMFDAPGLVAWELQKMGARIQSRYTTMENLQIRSPDDEIDRIRQEAMEDLALATAGAGAETQMPGETELAHKQLEKGGLPKELRSPGEKIKSTLRQMLGEGEPAAAQGSSPGTRGAPTSPAFAGRVTLADLSRALSRIPAESLKGNVWVMGGVVTEGWTDRDIDIMLSDTRDQPVIERALADIGVGLHFTRSETTPGGPHLDVKRKAVRVQGVVPGGGLKPAAVRPFHLVPVAKPEKKALTSNEVFSVQRLMQILPPQHEWDVSPKLDGIRCQLHKDGARIALLTDEGGVIPPAKVGPILREAKASLPVRCILDGELRLFLGGANTYHEGVAAYVHRGTSKPEELEGLVYEAWDLLWNGTDLTAKPFSDRRKILGSDSHGQIKILDHLQGPTERVPTMTRKMMSREGVVIRALDAAYWATHLMYKYKKFFDVDVKVVKVERTKAGAYVYICADAAGNIVGKTYGQSYLKAGVGDVIRVSVQTVQRYTKDGKETFHWYSPTPARPSGKAVEVRDKRADPPSVFREIWLSSKQAKQGAR